MELLLGLVLIFLLAYVGLGLLLLPLQLTLESIYRLVTIPAQLLRIAVNPRLRVNHALEHATINVIEEHCGPTTLTGLAREDGFLIRGTGDGRLVEEAAVVGLERLRRGERRLAVHSRCGTSAAAASFLVSLAFILIILNLGVLSPLGVAAALVTANVVGARLGSLVQAFLTTSLPGGGTRLVGVHPLRRRGPLFGWWLLRPRPEGFLVRTRVWGR